MDVVFLAQHSLRRDGKFDVDTVLVGGDLRLAGRAIAFSGLRSGEKLYAELLTDADKTLASPHPRLRIARLQDIGDRATLLGQLAATPAEGPLAARRWLEAAVADYRPESGSEGAAPRGEPARRPEANDAPVQPHV